MAALQYNILTLYLVLFETRKVQDIDPFVIVCLFHVQPFGFSRALTIRCVMARLAIMTLRVMLLYGLSPALSMT